MWKCLGALPVGSQHAVLISAKSWFALQGALHGRGATEVWYGYVSRLPVLSTAANHDVASILSSATENTLSSTTENTSTTKFLQKLSDGLLAGVVVESDDPGRATVTQEYAREFLKGSACYAGAVSLAGVLKGAMARKGARVSQHWII